MKEGILIASASEKERREKGKTPFFLSYGGNIFLVVGGGLQMRQLEEDLFLYSSFLGEGIRGACVTIQRPKVKLDL